MRVHSGLIVGLVAVLAVWVLMKRTVWGMEIRAVGENAPAARYAGIPVTATVLRVALLSGALAGLAGVGEVAGLKGYLTSDLSPGFGYAGIVVAMLAGLSPLGVVLAALFIAGVFVGADSMSRGLGVASYIADLVVALSLLCVLVGGFFTRFRLRWTGGRRISRAMMERHATITPLIPAQRGNPEFTAPALQMNRLGPRVRGDERDIRMRKWRSPGGRPAPLAMDLLDILLTANFWAAAIRIGTPLIFGVLGALICERSGVLNLGIEGIFTAGAMAGWMAVWLGMDLWPALLVVLLVGAVFGLLHATLTVPLGLSQHVTRHRHHAPRHQPVLLHLPHRAAGRDHAAAHRAVPAAGDSRCSPTCRSSARRCSARRR